MVVQLTLLGYILRPIFMIDSPWLVLGYASFMVVVATLEAISRPQYSYKAGGSRRLLMCHCAHPGAVGRAQSVLAGCEHS